jgi:hypothetical protein
MRGRGVSAGMSASARVQVMGRKQLRSFPANALNIGI